MRRDYGQKGQGGQPFFASASAVVAEEMADMLLEEGVTPEEVARKGA
jgi:hypothetical protein